MNGVDITSATLIINPGTGLTVGFLFGMVCYFTGRLTMKLDYRYQERAERRRRERRARKLAESAA